MQGHDPLWTVFEVATAFRVDPKTVRRWIDAGKLTPVLTPGGRLRVRESEVHALLAASTDARPGVFTSPPQEPGPGPDSKEGRAPRGEARP